MRCRRPGRGQGARRPPVRVRGGEAQPPPPSSSLPLSLLATPAARTAAGGHWPERGPISPLLSLSQISLSPSLSSLPLTLLPLSVGVAGGHPWRRRPLRAGVASPAPRLAVLSRPGLGQARATALAVACWREGAAAPSLFLPWGGRWPPQRRRAAGGSARPGGWKPPGRMKSPAAGGSPVATPGEK